MRERHLKKFQLVCLSFLIAGVAGGRAWAAGLIPGPGESGYDAALEAKALEYDRQFFTFNAAPFGLSLDVHISDEASRQLVRDFFAQSEEDFEEFAAGRHVFEVVEAYGEFGDLGMFGGVPSAGDAFRYAVLRDGGADPAQVAEQRGRVIRAMEAWHIYSAITGVPGVIARGIRRIEPEDPGDPPLPGGTPTLHPYPAPGECFPKGEHNYHADATGRFPGWVWKDDASKDQLDGYIYAVGALYDVTKDDPAIPQQLKDDLVEDARALGYALMEPLDPTGSGVEIDLVLRDADGCPVTFHDLNSRELEGVIFEEDFPLKNGFNALMALGVVRTIYHLTGDETIGRFYYEELLGRRDYISDIDSGLNFVYMGTKTNFSNVNMAYVAAYNALRYEAEPEVRARFQDVLSRVLWDPNKDRQARGLKQSLFDFIHAGLVAGGEDEEAITGGIETLGEFTDPPYFNDAVENCDEAEIASGSCVGIDGTPITIAAGEGRGGGPVAVDPVPKRIRPPSNYEWRSDPHDFNGGGGNRLNPGGDFRGAYWLGRFLRRSHPNTSPHARAAPPPRGDGGHGDGDGGGMDGGDEDGASGDGAVGEDGGASDGGCSCRVGTEPGPPVASLVCWLPIALLMVLRRVRWAALLCVYLFLAACDSGGDGEPEEEGFMWGFSTGAIRSVEYIYAWDPAPFEEKIDRLVRDLREIGADWLRPHVSWRKVEPVVEEVNLHVEDVTEGMVEAYAFNDSDKDWSMADKLIDSLVEGGIDLVVVINGAYSDNLPDYRSAPGGELELLIPDRVGEESYLGLIYLHTRAVVRRYRDRVRHWQIENELNVACETVYWGWREGDLWCDRNFLTRILDTLNQAVKAEDPQALTTMNFHTDIHWVEDVMEWEPHLDIIGLDAYPNYLSGDTPHGERVGERVRQALELGLAKPVMVLESGYPTQPAEKGFSEAGQVTYITDAAVSSYQAGAAGFFYFTFVSAETGGEGIQDVEPYWGLIRRDDTPKPAWEAYKEIMREYCCISSQGVSP